MRFALRVLRMQIGYPADLSARQPRHFLLRRQKKVSKEKATRMLLKSLGTSMCLALRVLRMQIGNPADLSVKKLRCSAQHTGTKPSRFR
jgi:hypothetical protein